MDNTRREAVLWQLLLSFRRVRVGMDQSCSSLDIFCNAAHLFNTGNHNPQLPLKEVLKTAESFFRWPSHPSYSKKTPARNPKQTIPPQKNNIIIAIVVLLAPLGSLLLLLVGIPLALCIEAATFAPPDSLARFASRRKPSSRKNTFIRKIADCSKQLLL